MDGHKIVLSEEFLQDFCYNKTNGYSKTVSHLNTAPEKSCKKPEQQLATCLSRYYDSIKKSGNRSNYPNIEDSFSKDFKGLLQCSNQFKEYEACVRKAL